jgi:hypothetical protein
MSDIRRIDVIEVLNPEPGILGVTRYEVIAVVDDIVPTHMAIYTPGLAEPEQFGPALCSTILEVSDGDKHPPLGAPAADIIAYLDDRSPDWTPINDPY